MLLERRGGKKGKGKSWWCHDVRVCTSKEAEEFSHFLKTWN